MKGQLVMSRFSIFAAFLGAAAVSIFCFVPQRSYSAEQTISAQWVPLGSGQEPLIDLTNTYSYKSSAWQDTPGRWKVWFCGGDTAGRREFDFLYRRRYANDARRKAGPRPGARGERYCGGRPARLLANGLIKYKRKTGAETYLLYYECAPRVYDRSRNLSRIKSFARFARPPAMTGPTGKSTTDRS